MKGRCGFCVGYKPGDATPPIVRADDGTVIHCPCCLGYCFTLYEGSCTARHLGYGSQKDLSAEDLDSQRGVGVVTDNGHIAPTHSVPLVGPRQTEKEFQQAILDYARLNGWRGYHTHDSRRSEPGFPDLVLVRPWKEPKYEFGPELLFVELKVGRNKPTADQSDWLEVLEQALRHSDSLQVHVWYPSDWPRIERLLARRSFKKVRT